MAERARRETLLTATLLLLASYAFRLPPLLNARSTNSDAAVVGLQAMHLLRGEFSPFLWGSGYQTSADALVAAAFFAVATPTPFTLMVSALTLHVAATGLAFATLRRRVRPWTALLLTMPLVVSPSSVHTYALYPPRQLSITLAMAALWAIDGAGWQTSSRPNRPGAWLVAGGALYGLAVSTDPYPMVLAPVVLVHALLVILVRPPHSPSDELRRRFVSALDSFALLGTRLCIGTAVGLIPFVLLHCFSGAKRGPMGLTTSVIEHNWTLLVRECLPWALSYKVYFAHHVMDYRPWDAPGVVRVVQIVGALTVLAIVLVGFFALHRREIPWASRRLGFVGALAFPVTIAAFLVSVMVMDHFSMRYLAVLTMMLPFASLPAAELFGGTRFAMLIAPHLVASAICGWVGYGPFVRGLRPVLETPELHDDDVLFDLLQRRRITYAEADYWTSYRLTFLFGERIVVVPTNAREDRYPPYRRAFEATSTFAYIYDPGRSREDLAEAERELRARNATVEKAYAGGHTVFLVAR